ncbi:unnamed protein product [Bursaphelenchus okinawaensis]|uniref:Uncharacterized protein n=1 Tax=Bursaphelenchus okinawaensis TaxID=465554 RepID=A0A811KR47_9BILA|nr:unnamed protein product [Bursaphelenchus okinawaensis]CAG9107579.1 unnamed protein product [Bursaphelenchus okinawaensis]
MLPHGDEDSEFDVVDCVRRMGMELPVNWAGNAVLYSDIRSGNSRKKQVIASVLEDYRKAIEPNLPSHPISTLLNTNYYCCHRYCSSFYTILDVINERNTMPLNIEDRKTYITHKIAFENSRHVLKIANETVCRVFYSDVYCLPKSFVYQSQKAIKNGKTVPNVDLRTVSKAKLHTITARRVEAITKFIKLRLEPSPMCGKCMVPLQFSRRTFVI